MGNIHDLPLEIITNIFRLGSEDVIPYPSVSYPSVKNPKRFLERRFLTINPFARSVSEVCKTWRSLVLADQSLRLVVLGTVCGDIEEWEKVVSVTGMCDIRIIYAQNGKPLFNA